jgi:hypothetical protein
MEFKLNGQLCLHNKTYSPEVGFQRDHKGVYWVLLFLPGHRRKRTGAVRKIIRSDQCAPVRAFFPEIVPLFHNHLQCLMQDLTATLYPFAQISHQCTHTVGYRKGINEVFVLINIHFHVKGKLVRHFEKKIIRESESR